MMIWIIAALIVVCAVAVLVWPLLRSERAGISRADGGIEVYRQQLDELERDVAEGLMSAANAEPLQLEIKRRILKIAGGRKNESLGPTGRNVVLIAVVLIVLPLATFILYVDLGSPDQPSRPLASRDLAAEQRIMVGTQGVDLVARLVAALQTQPDNLDGWVLLARTLSQMDRYQEAAETFMKATILSPRDAGLYVGAGENYYFNADGIVDEDAERAFTSALSLEPDNPGARYYLALRDAQKGNQDAALESWIALYRESPAEAPFMQVLARRIDETAKETGADIGDLLVSKSPALAIPGPDRADLEAAANMSAADRQEMILSMVSRLASRMEETPDYDGLMRLGQAYGTLEDYEKSAATYGQARAIRPDDPAAMVAEAFAYIQAGGNASTPPAAAIDLYRKLLIADPDMPQALWYVGRAEMQAGDTEKALVHWTRLQIRAPKGSPLYRMVTTAVNSLSAAPEN
ncbi:MAG: c-type cytochrome biogenesis protein CcmI [Sneathiella sp.]|nr:MAG: c-type cytochrome biogenesis protein CcmI [Sneathiella sp.]